jgi:hypothetical protein
VLVLRREATEIRSTRFKAAKVIITEPKRPHKAKDWLHVVFDAKKMEPIVIDSKGGSWISVPRLSNRSRVAICFSTPLVQCLNMSVPRCENLPLDSFKIFFGRLPQILVDRITPSTMDKRQLADSLIGAKALDPLQVVLLDDLPLIIKALVHAFGARTKSSATKIPVVVPHECLYSSGTQFLATFINLGIVSHNVSQTKHLINAKFI